MKQQNYKYENYTYWASLAKHKKRLILFYGEDVLDLTDFEKKHPAGKKAIQCYQLQNIKNILFRVYPHPDAVINVLKDYCIGKLKNLKQENNQNSVYKGICKERIAKTERKSEKRKKVKFDDGKENRQPKKSDIKQPIVIKDIKQVRIKMEEDPSNLQENKPELMIPSFDAKFSQMKYSRTKLHDE